MSRMRNHARKTSVAAIDIYCYILMYIAYAESAAAGQRPSYRASVAMENFKFVPDRKIVEALTLSRKLPLIPINPPLEMFLIEIGFGKRLLKQLGHFSVSRQNERMRWRFCELMCVLGVMHPGLQLCEFHSHVVASAVATYADATVVRYDTAIMTDAAVKHQHLSTWEKATPLSEKKASSRALDSA